MLSPASRHAMKSPQRLDLGALAGSSGLAAAAALVYAAFGLPFVLQSGHTAASLAVAAGLAAVLVALTAIDIRTLRLPDALTVPLVLAGLVLAAFGGMASLIWHGASAALGGVVLYAVAAFYAQVRGQDGLGLGDAKLFAAAGAWTGAEGLASILLIACMSGLAFALACKLAGKEISGSSAIPFGPFLALGLWMVWLYGPLA